MRKFAVGIITVSLLATWNLYGQQPKNQPKKDTTNPLAGTWTWVETGHLNSNKRTDLRAKKERMFAVITDTHSIYGIMDATTMQLEKVNFGCSYILEGNRWIETWDFGPNAGKKFTCEWKIEGDKLFKTLVDKKKGQSIQIWERFKRLPESPSADQDNSTEQSLDPKKESRQ